MVVYCRLVKAAVAPVGWLPAAGPATLGGRAGLLAAGAQEPVLLLVC